MNASFSFALSTTCVIGFVLISHGAKVLIEYTNTLIFEKSNLILLQLRNRVEFTKVECITQLPEILQVNCSINRTLNNVSALFVDFKLSQDVYSSNGTFSLFFKHGNNSIKYDTQNIDYCTVLANIQNQYLFQMIISGIRKISNIPLSCPFKKVNYEHKLFELLIILIFLQNMIYYVRGFVVDTKIIPSYFPEMSFHSETTFNWNGKLAVCFKAFGQLRRKR